MPRPPLAGHRRVSGHSGQRGPGTRFHRNRGFCDHVFGVWRAECDNARAVAAAMALDDCGLGRRGVAISLRWVLVHMIEEYARHNGHADLLRECIDGSTGD